MTIKQRLVISNVLMIFFPVILSVIAVIVCMIILNMMLNGTISVWFDLEIEELRRSEETVIRSQLLLILIVYIISFFFIMYLTNRLLIKYVFNKIKQPVEMLSDGVHQISSGNLDYRINYQMNDEFKQVCEDFNNMAFRLKISIDEVQKNELNRKELLSSISHDLRSPLTSIKAFVEGLLDGIAATPEAQREYLEIIKQKTDDINNMVSQLFLFSKMDMGNYPASPEKSDIGKELMDFISASQEDYRSRGLFISMSNIPIDKYIFADPIQLRSVFANVLNNSVMYKTRDTVDMTISCIPRDDLIHITLEDNGPGVPDDTVSKIFDLFYRGDPSRSNSQQGSGLGLTIAFKAIERMNGKIFAENVSTGGLRIIIEIPEMKGDQL